MEEEDRSRYRRLKMNIEQGLIDYEKNEISTANDLAQNQRNRRNENKHKKGQSY